MKNWAWRNWWWVVLGLLVWVPPALAQELVIQTTATTRNFLKATNAADARGRLGLVDTNVSVVAATGIASYMTTNGGTLGLKTGAPLPTMDAGSLTNLAGTNIQPGTINSNAFDAPTKALLGGGGVGNFGATNTSGYLVLTNGIVVTNGAGTAQITAQSIDVAYTSHFGPADYGLSVFSDGATYISAPGNIWNLTFDAGNHSFEMDASRLGILNGDGSYAVNLHTNAAAINVPTTFSDTVTLSNTMQLRGTNAGYATVANASGTTTITLAGSNGTVTATSFVGSLVATNATTVNSVLTSSGNQTNYTVPLLPGPSGNMLTIYTAGTNVNLTITGTNNADWQRSVLLRGWTNTITVSITLPAGCRTNANYVGWVTNGTAKVLNIYNPDTSGTNTLVSDAGRYQ